MYVLTRPAVVALALLAGCSPVTVAFKDAGGPTDGVDTGPVVDERRPDIEVGLTELDLGVILPGQTGTGTFTVKNVGDARLTGGLSLVGSAYTIDVTALALDPDVEQVVTVTFASTAVGAHDGAVTITSDDPDEPSLTVVLRGEVGADEDRDGWAGSQDCDDDDDEVHPGAEETWYDGVDSDCSGGSDFDQDGDGHDADAFGGDDCDDLDAAVSPSAEEAWYDGFDQDCDGRSDYDQDRDGHDADAYGGDDCDDTEPLAWPGRAEEVGNGIDDDCDGEVDETLSSIDTDGDGYAETDGDCVEGDASIHPGADETWYDGVDSDCSGTSDYDQDGDGVDSDAHGGDDCDDLDAAVLPGATETWYDGVDQDCSGTSDFDQDGDGVDSDAHGGLDCDDSDAAVLPGATETWYDGVDQDCSGTSDFDADGDGFDAEAYGGLDCDDLVATTSPDAAETWYDGVDQDCDGASDYDQDGDGFDADAHGGGDCDDLVATTNPDAADAWYDGVDADCDGASDYDRDADGFDADAHGGDDCDDDDAAVSPVAADAWYDGVDADCDGASDYDQDGDGHDASAYGGDDCDDLDAATSPSAAEVWYDGVDSDCSGGSDHDQDGDGHDAVASGGGDCADTDASRRPGAAETCDGEDDDCDGTADEGVTSTFYADGDGDGYGDAAASTAACAAPAGYVADATDCDDDDAGSNPGAREAAYDAADNDCDGIPDEMVAVDQTEWTILGDRASDALGSGGVHVVDDLDADGVPELVVASPYVNTSSTDIGMLAFHDYTSMGLDVSATGGWFEAYGNGGDDFFGSAFAVLGDIDSGEEEIVVGAYQNDIDNTDDGTVYVFDVNGAWGWDYGSSAAELAMYGDTNNSWTGYSLAVGDFDGDGTNEIATGAPGESSGKGQVYVTFLADFSSTAIDNDDSQFWVRGASNNDHLGYAVALGELTGDGYADLVACAPDDDDGGNNAGTCWIVAGNATRGTATDVQGANVNSVDVAVITGGAANDQLGKTPQSLSIGDFDGDDLDDLAVGMPGHDGAATDGGAVLIFQNGTLWGSKTSATASWLVRGDGALGTAVSMTGDVTGDGVADLLAGAPTAGAADEGVTYLLEGGLSMGTWTLPADQYASWVGEANGDLFGSAISGLGDLDGDGVLDFAVAATGNDDVASGAGKVYVLPAYP